MEKNKCEHEWVTKSYAYNFLVCNKCDGWLSEDGVTVLYGKKITHISTPVGKDAEWIKKRFIE